jgi:hypothetical protein
MCVAVPEVQPGVFELLIDRVTAIEHGRSHGEQEEWCKLRNDDDQQNDNRTDSCQCRNALLCDKTTIVEELSVDEESVFVLNSKAVNH